MKTSIFMIYQIKRGSIFFAEFLLTLFLLYGCGSSKPKISVTLFPFDFENEKYRIRSISSEDKAASFNELIGEKLLVTDIDQDGIIDRIVLGEVELDQAQRIYQYGLSMVAQEGKLHVRQTKVNRYVQQNADFYYEIRSFQSIGGTPYNEFKIIDNRQANPLIIVIVDYQADGILDEAINDTIDLGNVQSKYAELIQKGLQNGEMIRIENMILVKKK
jgi:hypothetical protein